MDMERTSRLQPVTEDDATIAKALEEANTPTLLMSLVHLTGDTSVLEGDIRPGAETLGDAEGGLTEEQQAKVREMALVALKEYRDRGCTLPASPGPDTIANMMSFMVGDEVPDEYVPMVMEEMYLVDEDERALHWDKNIPADVKNDFRVVIVGAGMSGILAAIRLGEAGIPYVVIEKNSEVGGTWWENTYPGCRVDVPNHYYSYSFEPNYDWPHHFSTYDDLFAYFDRVAEKYGVKENTRFNTEVVSADFDDASETWSVVIRGENGKEETLQANAVVCAVGQLNRPKLPDIPGVEDFSGPYFHSARWDHDVDLDGKRIAVVGTGASAFQFVPEIAKDAAQVFVFQRSAPWMFPTDDYHDPVEEGHRWCLKHVPGYANWYRFWLFWTLSDGLLPALTVDPSWNRLDQSANAENEEMRQMLVDYIHEQIGNDDPELLTKAIPNYVPGGKRMLRDNGSWLSALKRENVDVITDPISEITPSGPRTAAGDSYDVDVIVYATGFRADHMLWPMEVTGSKGVTLEDQWGEDDPRAYLGITVPGFPNMFCLYGPNTNLVHGGSIIFHVECQMRYVLGCIKLVLENGHRALECRREVHDAFNEKVDEANNSRTWGMPGINSWYRNSKGRVTQNWPWRLVDYWTATKSPDPSDFVFH